MSAGSLSFLGGASGRLLPASIPLRYFGAAVAYHLAAWIVLAAHGGDWIHFTGGLGWPLAALHLLTLGVFGMTALGAAAQLVPVATRQAPVGHRWLAALWWLYTPSVALLALGMGRADPPLLALGGAGVAVSLAVWAVLMVRALAGARGMPGVSVHAGLALASLAVLLASAVSLAATWLGWPAAPRHLALAWHVLFAPFGFMGLLALGLSYILVPMFALADPPAPRWQLASGALVAAGLVLGAVAVLGLVPQVLRPVAFGCGISGVVLHVHLMRRTLARGMRQELGRSFVLVKTGWAGLVASLLVGGALWLELPLPRAHGWFALAVVGVWLLGTLLGYLQRILPFLASLHAAAGKRRGPTASSLTHERALAIHLRCHLLALAGSALALATGSAAVAAAAALAGCAGAAAFGWFFLHALRRLKAA